MATILALKRRIQAARNVSKTTRAMQMISASKLKRAQEAAFADRPYVEKLNTLTKKVIAGTDKTIFTHPYIEQKTSTGKTLLIVMAPDKGLCGSLLTNLLKQLIILTRENKNNYYISLGKKIETKITLLTDQIIASFPFGTTTPTMDIVFPLIHLIDDYYIGGKVDKVKILYTHFTNFFSQTPEVKNLLPINIAEAEQPNEKQNEDEYLIEPKPAEILPVLLQHTLEMSLYHCLLESFLSEQASRMLAMQNATNNAKDIIADLLLEYNKTRQARITSELLDITGAGMAAAS